MYFLFLSAAVKFGRMSKKQRDSLYAEVQKHQKSQECAASGGKGSTALSLPRDDGVCGGSGEDGEEGLSRSYSSGGSSSTISDLDDIAALPDLFDLPLTPEEASEYCSLELLGGGTSTGNTSNSSSSSSSSSSSLSNQNSPQQTVLDGTDGTGIQLLHTNSHRHVLLGHTLLDHLPDDCSITDLGESKWSSITEFAFIPTLQTVCVLVIISVYKQALCYLIENQALMERWQFLYGLLFVMCHIARIFHFLLCALQTKNFCKMIHIKTVLSSSGTINPLLWNIYCNCVVFIKAVSTAKQNEL